MWFRIGEWVPFAGRQGCRCSFSIVHYFGAILKDPKACTLIPRVPRAPASRAGAESCRSHFGAQLLSWLLHSCRASCALGPWIWGDRSKRAREQPGTGWTAVPWGDFLGNPNLSWGCSSSQAEWPAPRPPRPCCRAHPQHRDNEHVVPPSPIPATL